MLNYFIFIVVTALCIYLLKPIIENMNIDTTKNKAFDNNKNIFYYVNAGNGYYRAIIQWNSSFPFGVYLINSMGYKITDFEINPIPYNSGFVHTGFWNIEQLRYEWFYYGYMIAKKGQEKILMNKKLEKVDIPYKYFGFDNMGDGFIWVSNGDKKGILDKNLHLILSLSYSYIKYLGNNKFEISKDGITRIIRYDEEKSCFFRVATLEAPIYEKISCKGKNFYKVKINEKGFGAYNEKYEVVIPFIYDDLKIDPVANRIVAIKDGQPYVYETT